MLFLTFPKTLPDLSCVITVSVNRYNLNMHDHGQFSYTDCPHRHLDWIISILLYLNSF